MSTTTTQPIWEDPVARLIGCAGATAVSMLALMVHVTIPYLFIPVLLKWRQVSHEALGNLTVSPDVVAEMLPMGPTIVTVLVFLSSALVVSVVLLVPVFVATGVPFIVSYAFWMRIVYGRILNERDSE